jgi:hypothetical protein
VDPALGVLEYAMKRKDQDLRGALQAARKALDPAKPGGEGDGLEAGVPPRQMCLVAG